MFFVFLFLRVHSTTWRRFNWRVVELLEGKVLFTKKTSSPRESFRLNFRKSCDTAQHFHQAWKTQVTTGEVNITAISGERKNAGLEGWIYKIRQPGDSKWPFDPLFGGHFTFPKGHVFTIPKRSPAELPGKHKLSCQIHQTEKFHLARLQRAREGAGALFLPVGTCSLLHLRERVERPKVLVVGGKFTLSNVHRLIEVIYIHLLRFWLRSFWRDLPYSWLFGSKLFLAKKKISQNKRWRNFDGFLLERSADLTLYLQVHFFDKKPRNDRGICSQKSSVLGFFSGPVWRCGIFSTTNCPVQHVRSIDPVAVERHLWTELFTDVSWQIFCCSFLLQEKQKNTMKIPKRLRF